MLIAPSESNSDGRIPPSASKASGQPSLSESRSKKSATPSSSESIQVVPTKRISLNSRLNLATSVSCKLRL